MAGRRRRGGHEHHEDHPDERWLLTYADMITLLLALFIVLFAMADPNPKKTDAAAKSVQAALNVSVSPGGTSIANTGGQADTDALKSSAPTPSLQDAISQQQPASEEDAAAEQQDLEELKKRIDSAAAEQELQKKVETTVARDGLHIRIMSDDLLFDSGSAELKRRSDKILARIAQLLRLDGTHAVRVSGHTDSVPVSGRYPSNWELSTARASAVVRALSRHRVSPARMEAAGKAHLAPIASNSTDRGRSKNRRVEILIPRQKVATAETSTATAG
jgi:chemotaxis protein MotB